MTKFVAHSIRIFTIAILVLVQLTSFGPQLVYGQDLANTDVSKVIAVEHLQHPYLFFTSTRKQEIIDRIAHDPESKHIYEKLKGEGKKLMYQPLDPTIPPRGTHDRAGWTEIDREGPYRQKQNRYQRSALVLAFLYQMTGEEAYAQKSFEFAEVVSSLPTWTWQAHEFPIIYSRVMPWNVPDDQVNFNYDLGNATTGMFMALVYDWIYTALETEQRDRIRGALLEKVITPVRGDYEFHWWASAYRTNWVGVCSSGLGLSALVLLNEHPQLADVVAESWNMINKMLNEIGQDGGWQEGGSYWRFGVERSVLFGYALKKASNGAIDLFKNDRLQTNPVAFPIFLFVPPNRSVDFGDSHHGAIGGTDFFNLLVNETKSTDGAWYREHILGEGDDLFDLIFPRPAVEGSLPSDASRHFRTIDWWVMRSDFTDENKVIVAGKAGRHDDPHHGHLDVGHFTLYWKGQAFIDDSGRPYYDEEYFDDERWTYPQASSAGHNTVLVNGEQQVPGKWRGKPFDYTIGGKVLTFESDQQQDYVLMDGTNAYPKKELKKWRRHITLKKPDITVVVDEVEAHSAGAEVEIRFHSEGSINLNQNYALLSGEHGAKMALISLAEEEAEFRGGQHAYQPIHATRPFQRLPYFGVVTNLKEKTTLMASVILPVIDDAEAQAVARSLSLDEKGKEVTVKFNYRGESYDFSYEQGADGLIAQ